MQFLRAVGGREHFLVRQGLFFASRRRNIVLDLGLSNPQRGPWALDCPTAYNDSRCVTAGLHVVSEEVAIVKMQFGVFIRAGWTVRQQRGKAITQPHSSNSAAAYLPRWTHLSSSLGERVRL